MAAKVAGPPSPTRKCVAVIAKYAVRMTLENPKVLEENAVPVAQ